LALLDRFPFDKEGNLKQECCVETVLETKTEDRKEKTAGGNPQEENGESSPLKELLSSQGMSGLPPQSTITTEIVWKYSTLQQRYCLNHFRSNLLSDKAH